MARTPNLPENNDFCSAVSILITLPAQKQRNLRLGYHLERFRGLKQDNATFPNDY